MRVVIIDYGSGNLRSVVKAFERAAHEMAISATIEVSNEVQRIRTADRIVLPGVGAYAHCRKSLDKIFGMIQTLEETVLKGGRPFLGICVGMQLLSSYGLEKECTYGLNWIKGSILPIKPDNKKLKVPHIGWNTIEITNPHRLFHNIQTGKNGLHAYFVHSYYFNCKDKKNCIAITNYGGAITAVVGHNNWIGTQFHPEKSQDLGLKFIANFLEWQP
ncbi:MAG: glutamine amidotransferase [Candidatus Tokpelaia sp. JSC161]|jgi:glutamine amidotransferase|nr:MAG: glutamine amidotransferase [Candidatus Tokpelaia sp. JSC161]